jgi:hypothetical protein
MPLKMAFAGKEIAKNGAFFRLPLYDQDEMFIQGQSDRVVVILGTKFSHPSDAVLGKVFLQELYDSRLKLTNTPTIFFDKKAPKEISQLVSNSDDMNFITFGNKSFTQTVFL